MATIMRGKLGCLLQNFSNFRKSQKTLFHCSSLLYGQGQEIKMPSLSPTMTQGKIIKWLKKEGDTLNPGDVLCDIETDKAIVSMEVEEEGILAKILVSENTSNIKVGSLIGLTVSEGEDWENVDVPSELGASTSDFSTTSILPTPASSSEPVVSGPSATPIKMPSLSPTMTAGTIVKWLKKEGDTVATGDVLCDIQTDKAVMSMEAEEDGILAKIIIPDDSKDVTVGTIIAVMVPEGEDWKSVTVTSSQPSAGKTESVQSQLVSSGVNEVRGKSFGPAVRALLAMYQLEPGLIKPTGRSNRILKEDVMKYVADNRLERKPPKVVSGPPKLAKSRTDKIETTFSKKPKGAPVGVSRYKDIELSNMQKITAKRLLESKQNIPHSYSVAKCNVNSLLKAKESLCADGIKVTINGLLTKATALALQLYPKANAVCINNEVKLCEKVDISVAVSMDSCSYMPVVRSTNLKSVISISQEIGELSAKAKTGQLKSEEFEGGTFMISNLGMHGVTHFKAIINPPQCGVLAVGGINETLNLDLVPHKQMILSLSYDRRALQEHEAAEFMETLKYFIENPKLITADGNHSVNNEL